MDVISTIVAAMTGGAAAGARGVATAAITDGYHSLLSAVRKGLARNPKARAVLDGYLTEPSRWEGQLVEILGHEHFDVESEAGRAATRLLELLAEQESTSSSYRVDMPDARGVQVGNHNLQRNDFA